MLVMSNVKQKALLDAAKSLKSMDERIDMCNESSSALSDEMSDFHNRLNDCEFSLENLERELDGLLHVVQTLSFNMEVALAVMSAIDHKVVTVTPEYAQRPGTAFLDEGYRLVKTTQDGSAEVWIKNTVEVG
jgi:chromosome segregation ATPase